MREYIRLINARIAREAGFAHEGYARLKLASVRLFVARLIMAIGGVSPSGAA